MKRKRERESFRTYLKISNFLAHPSRVHVYLSSPCVCRRIRIQTELYEYLTYSLTSAQYVLHGHRNKSVYFF